METQVLDLWRTYRAERDPDVRERLILRYTPLVTDVAGRMAARMPAHVDRADLASFGMFGLLDAIERFDPGTGNRFETYAATRVRGAIVDGLRSLDWVPRSVRRDARAIEQAIAALQAQLQRSPDDGEVAARLGWSVERLHEASARVALSEVAALDARPAGADGSLTLAETIAEHRPGPADHVDDAALRQLLRSAVRTLPEREQTVLASYYFEGMTLREIGELLGVTESRICQLHARSVLAVRQRLQRLTAG